MNPEILLPGTIISVGFIIYWVIRYPRIFCEALLFHDTPLPVSVLTWIVLAVPAAYLVLRP